MIRFLSALILLVAVALATPAGAAAEQASQPTAAAAGHLDGGAFHSCAVLTGARLRCWGFSGDGQLGYGNTNTVGDNEAPGSVGPVNLGIGRTVEEYAAGDYHGCAVLDDGMVRCWGYGFDGELGYGNRDNVGDDESPGSAGPVDLGSGRTATTISAGGLHTCAVLDDGSARCWGSGENGQLGYGDTSNIGDGGRGRSQTPGSAGPIDLGAGRTARAISAGGLHTCAVLDDGSVRCWGQGGSGQLGYGGTSFEPDPASAGAVDLGTGRTAKAISAGNLHTCAVLDNGSVRCWGHAADGELGYGNTIQIGDNELPGSVGPVALGAGRTALAISAGGAHTCALLDDHSVRCWGSGAGGRLGYGSTESVGDDEAPGSRGPVNLGAGRTAVAVTTGRDHTCARLDDGMVRCWGVAKSGRLGLCNASDIGDGELPGSVGPIPLEAPGGACPGGVGSGAGGGPLTPAAEGSYPVAPVDPLAEEARRRRAFRHCLAAAKRRPKRKRARARRACIKRHGRTPGRVRGLRARAASRSTIVISFTAPGTDGARPPAARAYLVKQSRRPIRSSRAFARAPALCNRSCRFRGVRVGTRITLSVTGLRPRTSYHYAVAARDNVSRKLGRRSKPAKAKTR